MTFKNRVNSMVTQVGLLLPKHVRGHAQTMWTAMGGGGVHEMSTLLIKPM